MSRATLPVERQLELAKEDFRLIQQELLEMRAALRTIKAVAVERVGK